MNQKEVISFKTTAGIELKGSLYRATTLRKEITIIYFHGGGLFFGDRDDLPKVYVNHFLRGGYDFLALDYPLAPETKIGGILQASSEALRFYLKNYNDPLGLKSNQYILFGRSAGAYLSFMVWDQLMSQGITLPKAIISLYGYTRFDEPEFNMPSKYYHKMAKIPDEIIKKIVSDTPVTYGPMNTRFFLYVKARQEGTWIRQLYDGQSPEGYSLAGEKLKLLPPTFLAAASQDPDVPYRISKTLSKEIPDAKLITIYGEMHDFDREPSSPSGSLVYEEMTQWLESRGL